MQIFRKYLNVKLSDPAFKKDYCNNCTVCPITVAIVKAIAESRISPNEIADLCGIPVQALSDLETAENCCVESVQKLCDYFGIQRPSRCLKLEGLDR